MKRTEAQFRPFWRKISRPAPEDGEGYVRDTLVPEAWVEAPLEGGWIAAYRLVPQAGVPVIGEIRIFPQEPRRDDTPGLWDGAWDGATPGRFVEVPDGGLSARVLRQVTVGEHLQSGSEALALLQQAPGWATMLRGFSSPKKRRRPKGPGGRPRRPDLFYAQLAATYVDALSSGHRNPVERVAVIVRQPAGRVRTMLHQARERGLLAGRQQGRASGQLTPRARVLIKQARRSGKKGGRK